MAIIATKKETIKKKCPICGDNKSIATGFYKSSSPLFSLDGCVPICISCVKKEVINKDGTVNENKLKTMCQRLDKPYYTDGLDSAFLQCKKEHGYLSDDEIAKYGNEIIGFYFKNINTLRQNRNKSFVDSEKDGFSHKTVNTNTQNKKEQTIQRYSDIRDKKQNTAISVTNNTIEQEELIYDDKWMGKYSQKDIDYLNSYYAGLERDYKIITENHRDYARKIAKASLQMDKAFDEMINGIEGADARYKNAREAFDTLSKSAKFSESTRSVNDVGISSFSKVAAMVESHNWIPEHIPLKKDTIDEMIDYLSTITKSL
ncbi:hypothetical protein [Roseburia sp. 1XD42-69]|uniref:hypothetical protein n=1 Tax=Roseburia sp. 1XD42-69 TaxID=2320088 RepID=UPI0018F60C4B|nr:hypothetical protein [Roseburia sp. 1XD42-69]